MILEQVRQSEQKRHASKNETFDELALQVADDASLDPDTVAEQLEGLGRTAEELANAAQLIVDRRGWAAQLLKESALLAEHNQLYAAQQAADTERDAVIRSAREQHASKSNEIQRRLASVDFERDSAQTAKNRLVETSPHHARLRKLWHEHSELVRALQERLPRELRQARPADVGFYKNEISRTQATADRLAAEIAQLEREALQP